MDIKEEFERIFGATVRPSLFDADDTEYLQLRQQIINSPKEVFSTESLPFEGVSLTSYEEFKMRETIEVAKKHGAHLFYIIEYDGSKLVRYAAGYFRVKDSCFVVLKDTYFKTSNYFTELTNSISDPGMKTAFLNSFRFEDDIIYQNVKRCYQSASLAASYILGRKASFREWKDEKGRSLDACYSLFRSVNIDEMEDKTFVQASTNVKLVSTVPDSAVNNQLHIFFIKRNGTIGRDCDASGTFDPINQKFVIRADSVLSLDMSATYSCSAAGITRRAFLKNFCAKKVGGYRLKKDHICDSPSAAAALVMGGIANGWEVWKDINGCSLDSVYRH